MIMQRQTTHHLPADRSWKSLFGYGYAYVSNLVFSSLGKDDWAAEQTWYGNRKRKREPTDEQPTAIYTRIVPDHGGACYQNNINFKTVSTASSTSKRMNETETTTVNPIMGLHQPDDQYVFPPSPTPAVQMCPSPVSPTSNNVPTLSHRNKLQIERQHLEHVTGTLKIKMADLDSKGKTIALRSRKLSPPKSDSHQGSSFLHQPIEFKAEPRSYTYVKKEYLATEPTNSVAATPAVARPSPFITRPSPLESNSLHGLLKRRKVLPDHPPPPGFALKHVDTSIKNTMDTIVGQIPHVKLRRTDTVCGPDGQWKPNPFWKEIYDNGKRRSRPL